MTMVLDIETCPQCSKFALHTSFDTRTLLESCACLACGYETREVRVISKQRRPHIRRIVRHGYGILQLQKPGQAGVTAILNMPPQADKARAWIEGLERQGYAVPLATLADPDEGTLIFLRGEPDPGWDENGVKSFDQDSLSEVD